MFKMNNYFNLISRCLFENFKNWYLKILFLKKINIKVLICIDYMQGELNISSTYRFMLSVSCIEELDISSLCDTRV